MCAVFLSCEGGIEYVCRRGHVTPPAYIPAYWYVSTNRNRTATDPYPSIPCSVILSL